MNMQQMMIQAQRIKRELDKAQNELKAKEFEIEKNGAVKVTMLGDGTVKSISIDEDAFDKDNIEMVEDLIVMAINELKENISKESEAINMRITGQKGGLGF